MDTQLSKNEKLSRFEISVAGEVAGYVEYADKDGVREFPGTEIEPRYRGQGLAGELVGYALNTTREEDLRIKAICPYVVSYLEKHPEYAKWVD